MDRLDGPNPIPRCFLRRRKAYRHVTLSAYHRHCDAVDERTGDAHIAELHLSSSVRKYVSGLEVYKLVLGS